MLLRLSIATGQKSPVTVCNVSTSGKAIGQRMQRRLEPDRAAAAIATCPHRSPDQKKKCSCERPALDSGWRSTGQRQTPSSYCAFGGDMLSVRAEVTTWRSMGCQSKS